MIPQVWDDTNSSRPVGHVRVSVSDAASGFVLIKKLHVLHPNPIKSSEADNRTNETYTVGVKQPSKIYKTSLAQDATISFRVLFPHKTKGWRRYVSPPITCHYEKIKRI